MLGPSIHAGEIRIWRGTSGTPCSLCMSCVATRSTAAAAVPGAENLPLPRDVIFGKEQQRHAVPCRDLLLVVARRAGVGAVGAGVDPLGHGQPDPPVAARRQLGSGFQDTASHVRAGTVQRRLLQPVAEGGRGEVGVVELGGDIARGLGRDNQSLDSAGFQDLGEPGRVHADATDEELLRPVSVLFGPAANVLGRHILVGRIVEFIVRKIVAHHGDDGGGAALPVAADPLHQPGNLRIGSIT
jgi:hypothetical protein